MIIFEPKSFISIGKNWAEVITNPFKLYKGFTTSGGMRSPIIMYGIDNIESNISQTFENIQKANNQLHQVQKYQNKKIQLHP